MSTARILVAASLGLLALSPGARAQRVSPVNGAKLLSLCTARSPTPCDAYISGIADAAATTDAVAGQTGRSLGICVPSQVTGVQLRQTVVASLKAHPEDNARAAVELVMRALKSSYACDKASG